MSSPIQLSGATNVDKEAQCLSDRSSQYNCRYMRNQSDPFSGIQGGSQRRSLEKTVREFSPRSPRPLDSQQWTLAQNGKEYGQYILEQAPRALTRIHEYLERNVISNLGIFNAAETESRPENPVRSSNTFRSKQADQNCPD